MSRSVCSAAFIVGGALLLYGCPKQTSEEAPSSGEPTTTSDQAGADKPADKPEEPVAEEEGEEKQEEEEKEEEEGGW